MYYRLPEPKVTTPVFWLSLISSLTFKDLKFNYLQEEKQIMIVLFLCKNLKLFFINHKNNKYVKQ